MNLKAIFTERGIFRDKDWLELSEILGGKFIRNISDRKIIVPYCEWTITLTDNSWEDPPWIILSAPYITKDRFCFEVFSKSPFGKIGYLLKKPDRNIQIEFPELDSACFKDGNDEEKLKQLFKNSKIKKLMPFDIGFQLYAKRLSRQSIKEKKNIHILKFELLDTSGLMFDIIRLQQLFDLFCALLDQLCCIGSVDKIRQT